MSIKLVEEPAIWQRIIRGKSIMWYFSWILGTGLACTFAILNALWLELRVDASKKDDHGNAAH